MKHACDDKICDLFNERTNSEDKIGMAKGFWPYLVKSTSDAELACLHVYGSGTWKRRCKKTYGKTDFRVLWKM